MATQKIISSFRGEYAFLSNFANAHVVLDGMDFPTVENAFQAAKTLDMAERQKFQSCPPDAAKRFGRQVSLRKDWEKAKFVIMRDLLTQKFAEGTEMRAKLDATGHARLVEGNTWHDNCWGCCTCAKCAGKRQQHNFLGRLLMAIRDNEPRKKEDGTSSDSDSATTREETDMTTLHDYIKANEETAKGAEIEAMARAAEEAQLRAVEDAGAEEEPQLPERVYVKRIRNANVVYGFYKEGRKYGISTAIYLPIGESYTWLHLQDHTHTKAQCNRTYKSLVKDLGFHVIPTHAKEA